METIVSQFRTEGLTFKNGRHHYYGDLKIDDDVVIWDNIVVHGDLIVAGNLTSHGKLVANNIKVGGNFNAGRNVIAGNIQVGGMFGCYANVRIKFDLEVGSYFWVDGNLHVGNVSCADTSTVHGWMVASTIDGDVMVDKESL